MLALKTDLYPPPVAFWKQNLSLCLRSLNQFGKLILPVLPLMQPPSPDAPPREPAADVPKSSLTIKSLSGVPIIRASRS